MENNLHGDMLYTKHAGEGSQSITDDEHAGASLPEKNNQESTVREPPITLTKTRSSPSHGRHPRGTRPHKRHSRTTNAEEPRPMADKTVRAAFLTKLFIILTIQTGTTCGIICIFLYWKYLDIWVQRRPWFCYSLLPLVFLMIIVIACCDEARRKAPMNVILLLLFTILQGTVLGSIASFFDAPSVMWAVGGISFVMLGMTIFSLQTKFNVDITSGVLLVLSFVPIVIGVLFAIMQFMWIQITYAGAGTLIFSLYVVVDTQLMLGKRHQYILTPDEYTFAALNVYVDIMHLCLFILRFVGFTK
ncbi:protein lifeguard 1-like [Tiliqua scincoides]|uniref:protein lifeguard 1-like n=1 Tax=Tiliqua scincoides TaxID=71010 RepID=UPI00346243AC